MPDFTGEMGYWKNPSDSIESTMAQDRAALERMQDIAPNRFQTTGPKEANPVILEKALALRDEGIDEGWDMTWVERLCRISLDDLYKQLIGSCVATSHITLLATRGLTEIVLFGDAEELLGRELSGQNSICPFGPYSYRVGRKYAGINGRGDGSTCSGQIRGTMALGYLPCDTSGLESDYFPEPRNTSLYRAWGSGDSYIDRYVNTAKLYDLTESIDINDVDTGKDLLVHHKKPSQICSGWGFRATNKRLPNGDILYTRSGSWPHSMQWIASCKMSDGNWYDKIRNQWGNAHSGKNYFWVAHEEMRTWIRNSNTMSIGELKQRDSVPEDLLFPIDN